MTILKMPFPRPKRWHLSEKWWTSYRVQSVDPFPIEKLHKFEQIWILAQKKKSTETKIFEKMPFRSLKRWNLAEKLWTLDGVLLIHLMPNLKFSKKCRFRGRNNGIWRKKMNLLWTPAHWPISNQKVALICVNLNSGANKKKKSTETKFF